MAISPTPSTDTPVEQAASGKPARASLIDPASLMRIKSLLLRAKVVVEGFFSGLHRSPFHGFSVEFSEYREYSPGDDPRYLDWRLYARSDRYYVKRFEDETNLRVHLLVDLSQSMSYGSVTYNKAEYARTIAATLAYFLYRQRDAVGLFTFTEQVDQYLPARYRTGHLQRLMAGLETATSGTGTDLDNPLEHVASVLHKRGLVILVSDLLTPVELLSSRLSYLTSRGHEVVVIRILDPEEVNFTFQSPAMFQDVETSRDLYVDPQGVREQYLRRFEEHETQVKNICAELGIEFCRFTTDQPLELTIFDFVNSRLQRGKGARSRRVSRNPSQASGSPR
ncbi:MAG: DUF58 domain-containing protein [Pirellulaceae bacterium]|nr:DUF58 domain-containing protein [Pirellulaceae bacterium]